MSNRKVKVQICLEGVESAVQAALGGADSIELCSNLAEGGTTPDSGNIEMIRQHVSAELNILIRPKPGDFLYSRLEFDVIKRSIEAVKNTGVDGVVVGLLQPDGQINKQQMRVLVEMARPLMVTFHRAFDHVDEAFGALDDLLDLGVDRVLTSGQAKVAEDGVNRIAALVAHADGGIEIVPGGGITQANVGKIIDFTGVDMIHAGSGTSEVVDGGMVFRASTAGLGPAGRQASDYSYRRTSASLVAALIEEANR